MVIKNELKVLCVCVCVSKYIHTTGSIINPSKIPQPPVSGPCCGQCPFGSVWVTPVPFGNESLPAKHHQPFDSRWRTAGRLPATRCLGCQSRFPCCNPNMSLRWREWSSANICSHYSSTGVWRETSRLQSAAWRVEEDSLSKTPRRACSIQGAVSKQKVVFWSSQSCRGLASEPWGRVRTGCVVLFTCEPGGVSDQDTRF